MSNDLRDLFKKELDQIPLRPSETWVPQRPSNRRSGFQWSRLLALAAVALIITAALIGGRELANFRERTSAAGPGVIAGKAIYLTPSFNGSGWTQIDPITLKDISGKPLFAIAPSDTNSSYTTTSRDGTTVIIGNFSGAKSTLSIYDARTGRLRGYLVPQVAMVVDGLSADGTMAFGRLGTNLTSLTDTKAIISVTDGHVIRTIPAAAIRGEIQAWTTALDLSAIYYVTTPQPLSLVPSAPLGMQSYSLVAQDTSSGALSAPIGLPGITGGAILSFGSQITPSEPTTYRPGIAFTDDRTRLAALSSDGQTLDVVDLKTLTVTSQAVRKKTSIFDILGPQIAAAKTINDSVQRPTVFTPDGTAILSYALRMHYQDTGGPTRTTDTIQRIDVPTATITAESAFIAGDYGFWVGPDGASLYVLVGPTTTPGSDYALRRLDAQTLEQKAERALPAFADLEILAAPIASPVAAPTPTAPDRTQPPATVCSTERVTYLVDTFFQAYNAHNPDGVITLMAFGSSALGGGFTDYVDNPGVPTNITSLRTLIKYLNDRFGMNDTFSNVRTTYPPSGSTSTVANPIGTFSRTFAGLTQTGNFQIDCNADRIVGVRIRSEAPITAPQTTEVDGYRWTAQLQFDPSFGAGPTDAAHVSLIEGVGLKCEWQRTGATVSDQLEVFGRPDSAAGLAKWDIVTTGQSGGRLGGLPPSAFATPSELRVVCAIRDQQGGEHGLEVVIEHASGTSGQAAVSRFAVIPWRK